MLYKNIKHAILSLGASTFSLLTYAQSLQIQHTAPIELSVSYKAMDIKCQSPKDFPKRKDECIVGWVGAVDDNKKHFYMKVVKLLGADADSNWVLQDTDVDTSERSDQYAIDAQDLDSVEIENAKLVNGFYQRWYTPTQIESQEQFKNNLQDGYRRTWSETGQLLTEELYKDGQKSGLSRTWHENGVLASKGSFVSDKEEGLWQTWHKNKTLTNKGSYSNGLKQGEWEENTVFSTEVFACKEPCDIVALNNQTGGEVVGSWKGTYLNGVRDGIWVYTNSENKEKQERNYALGSVVKAKEWYDTGALKSQGAFDKNASHYQEKNWYKNGVLESTGEYQGDQKIGKWQYWDENGIPIHKTIDRDSIVLVKTLYDKFSPKNSTQMQDDAMRNPNLNDKIGE